MDFPFGTTAIKFLVAHRNNVLNDLMQFVSFMGEVEGYVLIVTALYTMVDKKLAYHLAMLALVSMTFNHILKTLIAVQRPFVRENTYLQHWLVSPEKAQELVSEFSTPSGHAMSSMSFYGYLITKTKSAAFICALACVIILIGMSRPYIGVHFIEDVLLGWLFGLALLLLLLNSKIRSWLEKWNDFKLLTQVEIVASFSLIVWLITFYINTGRGGNQPLPFTGYLGFIMGLTIGYYLEKKTLNVNPQSKSWAMKLTRWIITVVVVMIPIVLLDRFIANYWTTAMYLSHLVQYFGYTISGFVGIFLSSCMFKKTGLINSYETQA